MTAHPRMSASIGSRYLRQCAAQLAETRREAKAMDNAVIMLTPESAEHLNEVLDLAADTMEAVARVRWPEVQE